MGHTTYAESDTSLTPHADESERGAGMVDRTVLDIAGEGWPFTDIGEFNGSTYGELWGRGAGSGARSSAPPWREPLSNTPACEKGYRGTPTSNGCF
jgi:hypothetical protein